MILQASFTLIYDVCSTGVTYDDRHMTIVICFLVQVSMTIINNVT
jgi:hypothetical protein